jgi:hypothetical protein
MLLSGEDSKSIVPHDDHRSVSPDSIARLDRNGPPSLRRRVCSVKRFGAVNPDGGSVLGKLALAKTVVNVTHG